MRGLAIRRELWESLYILASLFCSKVRQAGREYVNWHAVPPTAMARCNQQRHLKMRSSEEGERKRDERGI